MLEQDATPAKTPSQRSSSSNPSAGYQVAELYIERRGHGSMVGNVYKGKVDAVIDGLEAAFINIGLEKNAFLHIDEIVIPGIGPVQRNGHKNNKKISQLLKKGQEVIVQITKDPLKTKGARCSMKLAITGRYMVYQPSGQGVSVATRLPDKERTRLRNATKGLNIKSGGLSLRTAAYGAQRKDFVRELRYLLKLHQILTERASKQSAPSVVFQEADLAVRVIRGIFSADLEEVIIDDQVQYNKLRSFFELTSPELVGRVKLWQESKPLFEQSGANQAIDGLTTRRADLPSGGYLMVDYGEALTVFDVNSGSYIGRGRQAKLEETITATNLEAADEIVRQLRLRDVGGIIVIDFIDMTKADNRDQVMARLREALDKDPTKTFTAELSALGLVEMTRQNVTQGVREIISDTCPTCNGDAVVLSAYTMAIEFDVRLRQLAADSSPASEAFLIRINPKVSLEFTGAETRMLEELEEATGKLFHFQSNDSLPLEYFEVIMQGSAQEVQQRSVPFKAGDEVLVTLVEPHIYNANDAIAKINGYLIAVTDAGPLLGQQKMVMIETAGRNSATATLLEALSSPDN